MRRFASMIGITALFIAAFAVAAPAALATNGTTTCDGELAPGTYGHVVVPQGGACFSDGPVTITQGLAVERDGTVVFGSEENPVHTATISNGVVATDAANVQIHFSTINGGIRIHGGTGPFGAPFDVRWNTIEDSLIHGGVVIDGYNGFWMGFIRNNVRGTVTLNNNHLVDEDGNEYVTNTIRGNMNCSGNDPAPQAGDSGGEQNVVSGNKTGQCVNV